MTEVTPAHPNRRLSNFAAFVAGYTFVLITAGALVTGNNASLSDHTWPTFAGNVLPAKETFVRGLIYEDTHRILAGVFGLLVIALALWVQFTDRRLWLKLLAWGVVVATGLQGLVGGVIILYLRPVLVSMLHGVLGQSIFIGAAIIAAATSPFWEREHGSAGVRPGVVAFRVQCVLGTALVFGQLILGAATRFAYGFFTYLVVLHVCVAFLIIAAVIWLGMTVSHHFREVAPLRRSFVRLGWLIGTQVMLGIVAIFANRSRFALELKGPIPEAQFGLELEAPHQFLVLLSTAHVAVGALILITMALVTIQSFHLLRAEPAEERSMNRAGLAEGEAA